VQFREICRWTALFMKTIMASRRGKKNFTAKVQFENRPMGAADKKNDPCGFWKFNFPGRLERACNGKYASTFLFRSRGTSIPATLNIHAILLTTFQTSLSTGTFFIFLDIFIFLCFRSTFVHVAHNGATHRRKNSLSWN